MPDKYTIKPSAFAALAAWADLPMDRPRTRELTKVLPEFHARVDRLNAVEVDTFEFDFLNPLELDR